LYLTRVLGHPELAENNQWQLSNQCWVCLNWRIVDLQVHIDTLQNISKDVTTGSFKELQLVSSYNLWRPVPIVFNEDKYSGTFLLPPGTHYFWLFIDDHLAITESYPESSVGILVNTITVQPRNEKLKPFQEAGL
jgi:hypothetical protein